jgi:hypothetical protein
MDSRALDSSWRALSFTAFVMREIMDNPLEDETASARLKQVGLMSVLYCMHVGNQQLTLAAITAETGLTRGGVYETIAYLLKRSLLDETEVKNALGRGKARRFSIPERIFERIRQFERSPR